MMIRWCLLVAAWKAVVASDGLALISWLRTNGGFFSEKLEFRSLDPNDPTSPNGLFTKEALELNETIIVVPHKCLLTSPDGEPKTICATARALADHYYKGEKSFYKDYVDYLFDGTKRRRLPDRWSEEAKEIVNTIIGIELSSPFLKRTFEHDCGGSGDEIEEDAYDFVMARSWTEMMIPVWDMVNHKNGHGRNVESSSAHTGEDVTVYAYRAVDAEEQLFLSYNECLDTDCEGLFYTYGTQEILADYGFVEEYPQRWIWDSFSSLSDGHPPLIYELDLVTAPDPYSGEPMQQFQVTWHTESRPDLQMLNVMTSILKFLENLEEYVTDSTQSLKSEHERYTIREYYYAVQLALKYAIWSYYDEAIEVLGTNDDAENKRSSGRYYDTLEKRPVIGNPGDSTLSVCHPSKEIMGPGYRPFYKVKSQYQTIEFRYGVAEDDTCLWLSGWGQTCSSFRQYHEALVHYPASFLPEIKRVVYIGGGDNMILHEILKYPSIELVVGLELDQQVVRASFMNLGTLPYFDDPRVEWFFGDATKTLRILPPSYFGSFDLVLVDLQTFVADALFVTDTLSIMDTMKLLLQKDGIISKNEDFPNRKITDFAKYTVDMEYCDLPQICRQSITIGSNGVNFLTAPQYNHNIDRTYMNESLQREGRFNNWYDFRDNSRILEAKAPDSTTSSGSNSKHESPVESTSIRSKVGVLVVIEAERLSGAVATQEQFVGALTQGLATHGFKGEFVYYNDKGGDTFDISLHFREGYLLVRKTALVENYVAMDLLLWDAVGKLGRLKKDIIASIGGSEQTSSSYRLVTGGIHGIGEAPYLVSLNEENTCENPANKDEAMVKIGEIIAWGQLVNIIPSESANIVVLCGSADEVCASLEALISVSIGAVPLYSCPGVLNASNADDLFNCEANLMKTLRDSISRKINGIWLDKKAPKTMARVLLRLLTRPTGRAEILDEDNYVVLTQLTGEEWRETFMERFRDEISPFAPAKEARLSLQREMYFSLFSHGDSRFYSNLVSLIENLKAENGQGISLDSVTSGHAAYVPNFDPEFFNNADFDNSRAYNQWMSQKPIGYQIYFQMELQPPKPPLKVGESVLFQFDDHVWMGGWDDAQVVQINDDLTYDIEGENVGSHSNVPRDKLRRFDFDVEATPVPTIDVGARVLFEQGHWRQGFVVSRSEDGRTYEVRQYDADGAIVKIDAENLMPQYERTHQEELPSLSFGRLEKALGRALAKALEIEPTDVPLQGHIIADGCVITAFWQDGNAVLLWDGSRHIDINLYLDEEDDEVVEVVENEFRGKIPFLATVTKDEQPRGYGRVVNFSSEVDGDDRPVWWHADDEEDEDEEAYYYR